MDLCTDRCVGNDVVGIFLFAESIIKDEFNCEVLTSMLACSTNKLHMYCRSLCCKPSLLMAYGIILRRDECYQMLSIRTAYLTQRAGRTGLHRIATSPWILVCQIPILKRRHLRRIVCISMYCTLHSLVVWVGETEKGPSLQYSRY